VTMAVAGLPAGGYAGTVALVAQPSTAPTPDDPGGRGDDFGKSSPVGLVVLIAFVIAVILLIRSMNKHLKRVPESFDKPDEPAS
jgi:hypothetical protein